MDCNYVGLLVLIETVFVTVINNKKKIRAHNISRPIKHTICDRTIITGRRSVILTAVKYNIDPRINSRD